MSAKPGKNETESAFMSRCIHIEVGNGHPQSQAVAMCASMWNNKAKKTVVEDKPKKARKPEKPPHRQSSRSPGFHPDDRGS